MNRLLHASFDRFPQLVESRYDQAFLLPGLALPQAVAGRADHQRDRRGERPPGRAVPERTWSAGTCRWACCCATTACSTRSRRGAPAGRRQLYRAAAAAEILTWRHQVLTDLQHQRRPVAGRLPRGHDRPAGQPLPGNQGPAPAVASAERTWRSARGLTCSTKSMPQQHARPRSLAGPRTLRNGVGCARRALGGAALPCATARGQRLAREVRPLVQTWLAIPNTAQGEPCELRPPPAPLRRRILGHLTRPHHSFQTQGARFRPRPARLAPRGDRVRR